jgi:predicted nucleotidyltransferase
MNEKSGVFDEEIQKKIYDLCVKYGVLNLWLFGSRARGDSNMKSDFDFAYIMKPEFVGWDVYVFADELELVLNAKVDIVPYRFMNEQFRNRIIEEMVPVYEAA